MNGEERATKFVILREASMLAALESVQRKHKEVLEQMRIIRYRASELPVSRRVLSHWRNFGLIDIYGDNPDQTKLSFIGLFWLLIAIELRRFGLPLENINNIKDYFFKKSKMPLLESYFFLSSAWKHLDFFLIVSADGRADVATKKELEIAESLGLIEENYIKINFSIIKNRFMPHKEDVVKQKFSNSFITDDEASILDLIRDGEYQEISLKFNNGVVSHISKTSLLQNPDPVGELRKIIASSDGFCDISLKKVNGRIATMKTVIMRKT